jgi:hypothetical protein
MTRTFEIKFAYSPYDMVEKLIEAFRAKGLNASSRKTKDSYFTANGTVEAESRDEITLAARPLGFLNVEYGATYQTIVLEFKKDCVFHDTIRK